MSDKLFKNDKNYILKKVQLNTKKTLINYLILKSIERYELLTNPLIMMESEILKATPATGNRLHIVISMLEMNRS